MAFPAPPAPAIFDFVKDRKWEGVPELAAGKLGRWGIP
jgi:hypothetical protein